MPADCQNKEPLPELQPFYGVIDWHNFNAAKQVKKLLKKLRTLYATVPAVAADANASAGAAVAFPYHMYCNRNQATTVDLLDK